MTLRHLLLWLPMILIAFANAALRELFFIKHFNELRAHQWSTITLIFLCTVYVWLILPALNLQVPLQAILVGMVWGLCTVIFEFSLGRLTNKSWDYLFRDYNLLAGRLWLIFLFWLMGLPYFFYMLRDRFY